MTASFFRGDAPPNALFQGDVLVVAQSGITAVDPQLLTYEVRERKQCGRCGRELETDNCPDQKCQAPLKWPNNRIYVDGLKARQAKMKEGELLPAGVVSAVTPFTVRVGMVTSSCCDIDQTGTICFLGLRPLENLGESYRQKLINAGRLNTLWYLPGTDKLNACAVDLNAEFSLPAACVGKVDVYWSPKKNGRESVLIPFKETTDARLASLSLVGVKAFYAARFQHMTRTEADFELQGIELEAIEPERPKDIPVRGWRVPTPSWAKPSEPPRPVAVEPSEAHSVPK